MHRALPDEQVHVRLTAGDRSERGAA